MTTTERRDHKSAGNRFLMLPLLAATLVLGGIGMASADDKAETPPASVASLSLMTETPEQGFALAVKLSQKAVGITQPDVSVRKALRPLYATDPNSLIAVSHVVATHFQTVAAANNYWRK